MIFSETLISLRTKRYRFFWVWFACVTFTVQASIPSGYMPNSLASGSAIQLCPKNISAKLMAVLHSSHRQVERPPKPIMAMPSHHEHHHAVSNTRVDQSARTMDHSAHNTDAPLWASDCDFGAGTQSVLAFLRAYSLSCKPIIQAGYTCLENQCVLDPVLAHQHQPRAPPKIIS
jgi:hypothetical protein